MLREGTRKNSCLQFFNKIIQEIHSIQTSKKAEEALSSIALTGVRGAAADCEGRTCWLGKPRNGICQLFYTNNITIFFIFTPKKRKSNSFIPMYTNIDPPEKTDSPQYSGVNSPAPKSFPIPL